MYPDQQDFARLTDDLDKLELWVCSRGLMDVLRDELLLDRIPPDDGSREAWVDKWCKVQDAVERTLRAQGHAYSPDLAEEILETEKFVVDHWGAKWSTRFSEKELLTKANTTRSEPTGLPMPEASGSLGPRESSITRVDASPSDCARTPGPSRTKRKSANSDAFAEAPVKKAKASASSLKTPAETTAESVRESNPASPHQGSVWGSQTATTASEGLSSPSMFTVGLPRPTEPQPAEGVLAATPPAGPAESGSSRTPAGDTTRRRQELIEAKLRDLAVTLPLMHAEAQMWLRMWEESGEKLGHAEVERVESAGLHWPAHLL
ncbi:hypothetical protein FA95DRAFT_808219 [Auriscalpium vulgare]|uniref:Uncharacterized protein n=1 Tax=Auriscalpium vulgare TaxID=40419 RepID=A0ACB8RAR5_9AGAM|nr:hypothetical protein FA95DRAFT_808219 [Auriscalpium vulgare]